MIIVDAKGTINLTNFGIDTSGPFGGLITISGQQLEMNDSRISSHTVGEFDGLGINVQVDNVLMQDSDIIANTYGAGHGSYIKLLVIKDIIATRIDRPLGVEFNANAVGGSHIRTKTVGLGVIGDSGDIDVQARNITFQAAEIRTRSYSSGKSGSVRLNILDTFQAENALSLENSQVVPIVSGVHTFNFATGDSGNVNVTAQHILLKKGGQISANTLNAQGGNISVQADTITLKEQHPLGLPTAIGSSSLGIGASGHMEVQARQITLENGGAIANSVFASGQVNRLRVIVSDTLRISGIGEKPLITLGLPALPYPSNINSASSSTLEEGGQASDIYVQAKHIILENGGTIASLTYGGGDAGNAEVVADTIHISGSQYNGLLYRSGINNSSSNPAPYAGGSGSIDVTANNIMISDSGAINTSAVNAGGGNIHLNVRDMLYVFNQGSITTSVQSGLSDGGNITIESPQFLVMNNSPIIAQADAGHGGNIRIVADNFLKTPCSLVSASSRLGIDGHVEIDSPDETISGDLIQLSSGLERQEHRLKTCRAKNRVERSRFTVKRLEGIPLNPEDLRNSSLTYEN